MNKHLLYAAAFILLLSGFNINAQESKRKLTPADLVNIKNISAPQISPDGKWIAFVITEPKDSVNADKPADSNIWIIASDGSSSERKYALSNEADFYPQWSPNGKYLAFLSNRNSAANQIYLLPVNGGEAEPLTKLKNGVSSFKWSPDSRYIAFISKDTLTAEEEKSIKSKNDVYVVDGEYKFSRLYELNLLNLKIELLTDGNYNVNDFAYSPDGNSFVLNISSTPKLDDVYRKAKLQILGKTDKKVKSFTFGISGSVKWAPDSKSVLTSTYIGKNITALPSLVDIATGQIKLLFGSFKGSVSNIEFADNGNLLLFDGDMGVQPILALYDIQKDTYKTITQYSAGNNFSSSFSFDKNKSLITFLSSAVNSPADLFTINMNGKNLKRLTTLNPQFKSLLFGDIETVSWESKDKTKIEGILIKPVQYNQNKKYPAVVIVHGGPAGSWSLGWLADWYNWSQILANEGYLVLLPNPRGSTAYGWQFVEANHLDWGGGDYEDIMGGVNYLVNTGLADSTKLGVGGWSYGGYMTSWIVSQTTKFKAAIMGAGLPNLTSMFGTNDIPTLLTDYMETPYNNPNIYLERSAITHINKVKTPTLILHGQADLRVPISQGQEFYTALKTLGVNTLLVTYPRAGHSITERNHQIDLMKRVIDWYNKFLK